MTVAVEFNFPGLTVQQYDEIEKKLAEKDLSAPDGRKFHVAAPSETGLFVVDVWESAEKFNAFGKSLMPVMEAVGASPAQPTIREVHRIVE